MPDWLTSDLSSEGNVSLLGVAVRLSISFVFGFMIAVVYRFMRRNSQVNMPLAMTLVLLTGLIALVTVVIGSNVARAFSLVGALSIVRFRTVVEDTRDTAFVIFAVAAGMTVGSGYFREALVGIPLICMVALMLMAWESTTNGRPPDACLEIKLAMGIPPEKIITEVMSYFSDCRLIGASTAKQGSAIELKYNVIWRNRPEVVSLINALTCQEGVVSVEIREK
jgi:uncharacterized membrane protein YhiD involved in acid resistance